MPRLRSASSARLRSDGTIARARSMISSRVGIGPPALSGRCRSYAMISPLANVSRPEGFMIVPGTRNHYHVPANDKTVHWGYFSKLLKPLIEVSSGDFVTIEALTHHANDDAERMV